MRYQHHVTADPGDYRRIDGQTAAMILEMSGVLTKGSPTLTILM